jgi:peptide/nickel transport system permease protein
MDNRELFSSMLRSPRALGGLVLTGIVALGAIFAPVIVRHPPEQMDLVLRLKPPVWYADGVPGYLLGTDQLGRDLFSRIVYGARVSLVASGVSVLIAGIIGVTLGMLAGFNRGTFDQVIMRLVDLQLSFPVILLAIIMMAVLRPSMVSVIIILSITGWASYARLVRSQVLSLREREFVLAARAIGCTATRIMSRHILPNLVSIITVVATIQLARNVLVESALSFLGLGILPPNPSWGSIVNDGRGYVWSAWWIGTFPGFAIVITVSGIGLLGDWLRDYIDPRLRRPKN